MWNAHFKSPNMNFVSHIVICNIVSLPFNVCVYVVIAVQWLEFRILN